MDFLICDSVNSITVLCMGSVINFYLEVFFTFVKYDPYGSNWGHKIVALEFCLISPLLLLLYLQNVLRCSECIKKYWEGICGESK